MDIISLVLSDIVEAEVVCPPVLPVASYDSGTPYTDDYRTVFHIHLRDDRGRGKCPLGYVPFVLIPVERRIRENAVRIHIDRTISSCTTFNSFNINLACQGKQLDKFRLFCAISCGFYTISSVW